VLDYKLPCLSLSLKFPSTKELRYWMACV